MPNHSHLGQLLPIDYAEVLERIGGDRAFLEELLKIYVEDYEEKSTLIREALVSQDFGSVQKLGHSLKGSSANLSLVFLQKASLDLELAGQNRNLELARCAFASLEEAFKKLRDYLEQNPPAAQGG